MLVFQKIHGEIEKLDFQLKEKMKENKRLKENFDTLKEGNENLRKQVRYDFTYNWTKILNDPYCMIYYKSSKKMRYAFVSYRLIECLKCKGYK